MMKYPCVRWLDIKKYSPEKNELYLVQADYNGLQTFDVAYYEGTRPEGGHWWIMSNIDIPQECIKAFARINYFQLGDVMS